jgi:hypothetical protein
MATARILNHHDYIAWVCALPLEMAAADEIQYPDPTYQQAQSIKIPYVLLGRIRAHNVVIVCLPSGVYSTTSAVTVANRITFRSIRFGLIVGIGG